VQVAGLGFFTTATSVLIGRYADGLSKMMNDGRLKWKAAVSDVQEEQMERNRAAAAAQRDEKMRLKQLTH
jgi:hypothetical protein